MNAPVVDVRALRKVYRVTERETGLAATFRSIVKRRYREVLAVDGITFRIDPGEVVGFLGPNGAGKTTTLKMLSGLLYPTGGETTALGHGPGGPEGDFLGGVSPLIGNRPHVRWDIPPANSFPWLKGIYPGPPAPYNAQPR